MKRVCATVLVAVLAMVCLFGCSYQRNPLLGTWYAKVDVMPQIQERLQEEFPDFADTLPQAPFWVIVEVTFSADGSYQAKVDEDSVQASYDSYMAVLEDEIWNYLEKLYREQNPGGSVESYLQSMGISREALFEEIIGTFFLQELLIELNVNHEGEYEQAEGRVYLSRLGNMKYYHEFEVKGESDSQMLTLEPGSYQKESQTEYYAQVLPITLQREKP